LHADFGIIVCVESADHVRGFVGGLADLLDLEFVTWEQTASGGGTWRNQRPLSGPLTCEVRPELAQVRDDCQFIRHGQDVHIRRLDHPGNAQNFSRVEGDFTVMPHVVWI